jgi:hypothetical protein
MKPECSEYQKNIAKSLLGDLTAEEARALENHLAACLQCQEEKESYLQTLQLMKSVGNEPVPHHFFVHPQERELTPWALFRLMKPRWQAMAAALAGLFIVISIVWIMGLTRTEVDVAALKKDILKAVADQDRELRAAWLQEVQAEIARSQTELTKQHKIELAASFARLDSHLTKRMTTAEDRVRDETKEIAVNLYRTVTRDRARDLKLIDLRFDRMETNNAIETRQTDAILDTLLQAAELRLK